jgi:hypothetical protein
LNRPGWRGRENLLMFMRHWTAGWLKREHSALYQKLPWSFGNGLAVAVGAIRAVIIAARGVTISSNFLAGLLEPDVIVRHCDERYQPCGWTAPSSRTVERKFEGVVKAVPAPAILVLVY